MNLDALAVEMPLVGSHPNRVPFRGVLTQVDQASQRAPAGARGHRVLLTRQAAEAALPSLIGMALDYTPKLDGHDARMKVGIITSAEVAVDQLEIAGYLFARDFPDLMGEMNSHGGQLGLSYELADARVEDVRATIWKLTEVTFTGAAILKKEKAAYANTSIRIVAGANKKIMKTGAKQTMDKQQTEQLIVVSQRMADVAEALSATIGNIQAQQDDLAIKIERIVAAVEEESALRLRLEELEKSNTELAEKLAAIFAADGVQKELQKSGAARKTVPSLLGILLAKNGIEVSDTMDAAAIDASLQPLSIEQRIAVKAQMARAGLLV